MEMAELAAAAQLLRAGVDALVDIDLSTAPGADVVELLRLVEVERNRLPIVDQRLIAEMTHRGTDGEHARHSPADLLVSMLRVSPAEARARVTRATDVGPRREVDGTPMPPLLPAVNDAQHLGSISPAHVDVITDSIERIPLAIAAEVTPVAERFLVDAAHHEHPRALARTATLLLGRLDPQGLAARAEEIERRREVTLVTRPDGSSSPRGLLSAEATATWQAILDALSAPRPAGVDGAPDARTAGQRRHDALLEAGLRLLRSGSLPDSGGVAATVLLRASAEDLRDAAGIAVTGHGDVVDVKQLAHLACEARVVPVVFDDIGAILGYGRTRRLATAGQRLALAARDGGCCFPGCDRPAAWAEVHHIRSWIDDGPTDLDNLCLLCAFHHREFERRGWMVEMADGIPQWIPPAWMDPNRRPRRNTAHHLAELKLSA